jgi:hypothetical protein
MNETSGGSDGAGLGGSFAAGPVPGFGGGQPLLAQTLGLAMARRAADILDRHRDMHDRAAPDHESPEAEQFALDDAIFTAVLDAANECLGQFDSRPPADRWCDALLHLLNLAQYVPD